MRRHLKAAVALSALLLLTSALGVTLASATAPAVSINAASGASYTSAHVSGKVDPGDQEAFWYFQYSTDPTNEFSWQWANVSGSLAANSGEATVEGDLVGLKPGTEYTVRLVAQNGDGQTTSAGPLPTFTTDPVAPASATISAPTSITSSSAHLAGTINPNSPAGNPAAYDVNWTFECTPACPGAPSGTITADSATHGVSGDLENLKPGTAYEVRLVGINASGPANSPSESFTTDTQGPKIGELDASATWSEATLLGTVNPGGLETNYHFEYGTGGTFGASTSPRVLKAGGDPIEVQAHLRSLDPATTYSFKLVAVNSRGSRELIGRAFTTLGRGSNEACTNTTIRIAQGSTFLPECRAYEMVSPADKGGQGIYANTGSGTYGGWVFPEAVSPSGSTASFQSIGVFGDAQAGNTLNDYVANRTPSGWRTHSLSAYGYFSGYFSSNLNVAGWSTDLNRSILATSGISGSGTEPPPLAPGATPEAANLYLQDIGSETFASVTLRPATSGPFAGNLLTYIDGSDDLGTAVFEDSVHHTSDTPPATSTEPYVWHEGKLQLLSILPDPDGSGPEVGEPAPEGAVAGSGPGHQANVVSSDGSRIFFSTPAGRLYVREGGTRTAEVSASQKAIPDPQQPATYRTATADGRFCFFTTDEQLLSDDTDALTDLYRYDVESGRLLLVSAGAGNVKSVAGVSNDGSYAYFTSNSTGRAEVPPGAGYSEIFVWHDGNIRYIGDGGSSAELELELSTYSSVGVSANGRGVVFRSDASQPLAGVSNPTAVQEVYLYDAVQNSLTCVSCRPDGQPSRAESFLPRGRFETIFYAQEPSVRPLSISADGRTVFFSSPNPLVPSDTNGVLDAYEYVGGAPHLISSGRSEYPSLLVNSTPDDRSAFFATAQRLLPIDSDEAADIYVARVEGGFHEIQAGPGCEGEACRGDAAGQAAPVSPGSSAIQSPTKKRSGAKPKHKHKHHHKKTQKKRHKKRHRKERHKKPTAARSETSSDRGRR